MKLRWPLRRRRHHQVDVELDPWRRFRFGLLALAAVLAVGTLGYTLLGLTVFDALYQTAITITTLGFGEVGIEDADTEYYRWFTLALVLTGAGTVVYTASVLLESLVEGSLNDDLRRRRMNRRIAHMTDHVIVVGWGRVGKAIASYVLRHGAEVVVVDRGEVDTEGLPLVVGDAHEDDTLIDAGIEHASVLIAALDTDSANLALTLTARSLRPDIALVARTAEQRNEKKFFQAGANRVVNPHEIGGSRMAALAMHPTVAEFIDEVLHDESHDAQIIEVTIGTDSPMIGEPLSAVTGDGKAMVIAMRLATGRYVVNPDGSQEIGSGDVLIALGRRDEVAQLESAVSRRRSIVFRGNHAEG